jgi:hypothetical protein
VTLRVFVMSSCSVTHQRHVISANGQLRRHRLLPTAALFRRIASESPAGCRGRRGKRFARDSRASGSDAVSGVRTMRRALDIRLAIIVGALCLPACGGGGGSTMSPSPGNGPVGATVTITSSGVTPKAVTVNVGAGNHHDSLRPLQLLTKARRSRRTHEDLYLKTLRVTSWLFVSS